MSLNDEERKIVHIMQQRKILHIELQLPNLLLKK